MGMEIHGNPELTGRGADQSVTSTQTGGNMEGKETRFGPAACGLYAGVDHRHLHRRGQLHARQLSPRSAAWPR